MNFTEHWHEEEWLKCARDFEYFSSNYIEIRSLTQGACKFKMYPYQKRVLQNFSANRFNIVRKFRQGGLTTLSVLWALWMCMFRPNKQILVISKTDLEAIKAGKTVKRALDVIRETNPWLAPRMAEDSKHTMTFLDTKSELEFGSTNRARGQALNYVIVDEAAFIPNMEEVWADMYPTIATGGNVILVSTVNGMGNWYHKMYSDAEKGNNGFNVIDLSYKEHPDYVKPGWAEEARANLGDRLFAQEILGSFLGSGETYIPTNILMSYDQEVRNKHIIKRLFAEWDSEPRHIKIESDDKELNIWQKGALWIWQEPIHGHEYVIGVDVAEGVGEDGDFSAFQIFDSGTMEQVGEFRSNTVPPHIFAMIVARTGIYYNTALVVVENAGPGLAILDKMENNLYYENLYYQRTRTQERAGITMNKTSRTVILEAMQNYMQNKIVKLNSTRLISELHTFVFDRQKKRPEAQPGEHDDLVMSLAITLYARDKYMRDVPVGISMPTNLADSMNARHAEQIRREIEDSAPTDILFKDNDEKESWELDDVLPGIIMPFERPDDDIKREFGW